MTNSQLINLASISTLFFCKLTILEIDLDFDENIDLAIFSTILTKCSNLEHFRMWRRMILNQQKFLWIPKMDKLVSFHFATSYWIRAISYSKVPSIVDVEAEKCNNNGGSTLAKLEIDFGEREYPELMELCVAPSCSLAYKNLCQFPELHDLRPLQHLRISEDDLVPVYQTLDTVHLYPDMKLDIIQEIPLGLPNLTTLYLLLPSVGTLRCIIQTLANTHLKSLEMVVNYQFESALSTALRGLPFKLVTENDKARFEKMKQYEHWKGFLDYLKIEIPDEESNSIETEIQMIGIGSFKHLEKLQIGHVGRVVHVPKANMHWSSPQVQLSTEHWALEDYLTVPTCMLVDELTKLKGVLKKVNLRRFKVEAGAAAQFRRAMGFKLRFQTTNRGNDHLNCYSDRDLLISATNDIKQEEQENLDG